MNRDLDDLVQMVRPPRPEEPSAERLARERQQIFHEHQSGSISHGQPGNPARQAQPLPGEGSGPMERADVCVLDERGGHHQLGHRCPHFTDLDRDHVETVDFLA